MMKKLIWWDTSGYFVGGYEDHFILKNYPSYIDNVFIYPQFRQNGYSYSILRHVEKILLSEKYESVSLACKANNDVALHVYNRYGFKVVRSNWLVKVFRKILRPITV